MVSDQKVSQLERRKFRNMSIAVMATQETAKRR
jgi:hypothetical protein